MLSLRSNNFNETFSALLLDLKNTLDAIPPEVIKSLPTNLVDKARVFATNEFILDDTAMVNSLDGYKLNSMIRYLTVNSFQYQLISQQVPFEQYRLFGSEIILTDTINVPDGYDGRDGFSGLEVRRDYGGDVKSAFSQIIGRHKQGNPLSNVRIKLTHNKNTIDFELYVNNRDRKDYEMPLLSEPMTIYVILWRRKNV